jgi:hypothetical protein
MQSEENPMDLAARRAVELGNELANEDQQADMWDIADGLLAGAIHYWLYSRQPCSDPMCEDCASISTAELRMGELQKLLAEFAQGSDYFHSPHDSNTGHA